MRVFASTVIARPAATVWATVRDFTGLTAWSNVVDSAEITNGLDADQVGAVRRLVLADGAVFDETLVALSDADRMLSYDIVASPLPVTDYVATMRVDTVTDIDAAFVAWSAAFDPAAGQADAMRTVVGEQICAGGLAALKSWLESQPA